MKLEGLVYVIPTPLAEDETVDVPAARVLVTRAIETGADVLWVLGSGGEQPFLTDSQRRVMLETAVVEAAGRAPVIAGAMDCSTNRALANLDMLAETGADYATLLPPYYFKLSQAQIVAFYTRLAEQGPLPLVLYNNIDVSKVGMTPETVAELASVPNIVAIKESSADLRTFQQILYAVGDCPDFRVLSGSDQLAHASRLVGGHGQICGFGCLVPDLYTGMYRAVREGDLAAGRECQRKLVSLARVVYGSGASISVTKYALNLLGLCPPHTCAPFGSAPEEAKSRVADALRTLGLL